MRLSQQSDYALRLLTHLAVNDNRLVTVSETATHFDISRNHLAKIAQLLGQKGFIETFKGRGGGIRLSRSPEDITVGAVVRHMESDSALVECFPGGNNNCLISANCRLKSAFAKALEAFFSTLDDCSLKDLIANNRGLSATLRMGDAA